MKIRNNGLGSLLRKGDLVHFESWDTFAKSVPESIWEIFPEAHAVLGINEDSRISLKNFEEYLWNCDDLLLVCRHCQRQIVFLRKETAFDKCFRCIIDRRNCAREEFVGMLSDELLTLLGEYDEKERHYLRMLLSGEKCFVKEDRGNWRGEFSEKLSHKSRELFVAYCLAEDERDRLFLGI